VHFDTILMKRSSGHLEDALTRTLEACAT
jgi:hypothetical protein